ncbi:hypothetical protein ABS772_08845 [Methylorubrum podarium]|uniref:DUF4126 domain-containing protein n=1 Tax=Methylorubrum podarium TaxID=200476 RepID=A0ABV1QKZ7_9HYPH
MQEYGASLGIGFVAGIRSMSACAALTWAASQGRTRGDLIPAGPGARALATTAAAAEMAGDKMPFAPDRRIAPSFALRLVIGAVGGWALAGRQASPEYGALAGVAGAVAGTLLGRAARGGDPHTAAGRSKGLAEDVVAAGLAALVVAYAEPKNRSRTFP